MPSIHGSLDQLQPLIQVSIAAYDRPQERETFSALIDTGATRTCLTSRLIQRFGLPMRMKMLVASAQSGPERRRAYGFSLGLYCQRSNEDKRRTLYVFPQEFVAPDFRDNDNFDVLLGMDLLSQGTLTFERGDFSFVF